MEIFEVDGHEIVIKSTEVQAPSGCLCAVNVERSCMEHAIPELHEVHQRHFDDLIASISSDSTHLPVRIEFTLNSMSSDTMLNIVAELFVQAFALHKQRQIERSKRAHPSSGARASAPTSPKVGSTKKEAAKLRAVPRLRYKR